MFNKITSKFFGSSNERQIKKYKPIVDKINKLENDFTNLSNDHLKSKTLDFKNRLSNEESMETILPEAFATVREAAKRTLNQRHFGL